MHTWGLPIFCSFADSILRLFEAPSWVLWPLLLATLVRILTEHTLLSPGSECTDEWS